MAVLERSYKRFQGTLSPEWSRFLIIPRHAFRDVFRSKLFTAFFALSFIWPLVCAILIYLHHNVEALGIMKINLRNLLPIDAAFFQTYVIVQGTIGFFLAMLVGPQQVSRDLTNNALPLYLCRPFTRTEYVVGKMSILIILISAVTWVPGLILFPAAELSGRLVLVRGEHLDCQRNLYRQPGLDSPARFDVPGNLGLGKVAGGCASGDAGAFFHSHRLCRHRQRNISRRIGATSSICAR